MHSTPFRQIEAEALAQMTPADLAEFNAGLDAAERELQQSEATYAPTAAGRNLAYSRLRQTPI